MTDYKHVLQFCFIKFKGKTLTLCKSFLSSGIMLTPLKHAQFRPLSSLSAFFSFFSPLLKVFSDILKYRLISQGIQEEESHTCQRHVML